MVATKMNNLTERIKKIGLWLMLLAIGFMCTTVRSEAAGITTLKVRGSFLYSQSPAMLKYINDARKAAGSKEIKIDPNLSAAAMQRAAELSVDMSHTRPNGRAFNTVTKYTSQYACSENITLGTIPSNGPAIAKVAFDSFMRSNKGHRENMLNAKHTSVGLGFFTANNKYYVVQIFSNTSKGGGSLPADKTETKKIEIADGAYKLVMICKNSKLPARPGTVYQMAVSNNNKGAESTYSRFHASCFSWKSSAPKVASVDASGNVRLLKAGTATITATPKTGRMKAASVRINVAGNGGTAGGTVSGQKVTSVTISKKSAVLAVGGKLTLKASVVPATATDKKITWKSTNTSVVKVDSNGNVTAVGRGTAWIQAKSGNGMCTTCYITVK